MALLSACGGGGSGGSPANQPALSGTYDLSAAAEVLVPASLTAVAPTLPGGLKCSYSNGNLPPGMALAGDCSLTGTPTQPGRFDAQVLVTASGYSGSATVRLSVDIGGPVLAVSEPAEARMLSAVDTNARAYFQAAGMFSTRPSDVSNFSVTAGKLPAGLTLDPKTGAFTGTPLETGDFEITVSATLDRSGQRLTLLPATRKFKVGVPGLTFSYYGAFVNAVDMGELKPVIPVQPSTEMLGPYRPVRFEFVGAAPPGLKLDAATGVLAGIIDTAFQASFVVRISLATADGLQYSVDTAPVEVRVNGVLPIYDPRDCLPPGASICYVPFRLGQVYKGSNVFIPRAMFQGQAGDSYAFEILPPLDSSTLPSWAVVNPTTGVVSITVPDDAERRVYGLRLKVTTQRGGKSFSSIQTWSFTIA
ncbi:MAG: putative Ig domain-containing protein [Burkholderiales bacterium]|nr:putative Ig domain-containing protein [Burkholderiales bacterium]